MKVYLQSGMLEQGEIQAGEVPRQIDRQGRIVYCGNFESMNGLVEVKEEHVKRIVENHNALISKIARLANGEIPLKFCPPVQLDHSVKSSDTVGRLVGEVTLGEYEVEPGMKVPAIFGTLRILGKDNVERVLDGRFSNLSIGADLEKGKLSEISFTPFPAAADAMLLARGEGKTEDYKGQKIRVFKGDQLDWYCEALDQKMGPFTSEEDARSAAKQIVDGGKTQEKLHKGGSMFEGLKAFVMRTMKLSSEDADKKLGEMKDEEKKELAEKEKQDKERLRKHVMKKHSLSEEDAEKKLKEMDQEEVKKLAAEVDEEEKKLAAEADAQKKKEEDEKKTKMSSNTEKLTKLCADFRSKKSDTLISLKKSKISLRLARLRAQAKLMPSEIKKIDIAKLSAENDATIDAVLKTYEDREPVIMTGMIGTRKAMAASEAYKQTRMSNLEMETRMNMPLLRGTVKLQKEEEGSPDTVNVHIDTDPHTDMWGEYDSIMKMIDEGKKDEAKEALKKHMAKYSKRLAMTDDETTVDSEKELSALADSVKRLQNDFEQVVQLASDLTGIQKL